MKIAIVILKYLLELCSVIVPIFIILKLEGTLNQGWLFVFSPLVILTILSFFFIIIIALKNKKRYNGEEKNV